jgi:hypothetical protein
MMGTVWLRLQTSQEYIQPLINAIVCTRALSQQRYLQKVLVLWLRIYEFHGGRLRTSLPRRPSHVYQRESQRLVWCRQLPHCKLSNWATLSLYVNPFLLFFFSFFTTFKLTHSSLDRNSLFCNKLLALQLPA